ncbi:nuclear transport factor 2 family protein [Smaragdicoccus niigatensis]|uniref:nuclear transport factor 2 family protein n=1 Tax=Smaragdicoccus niigatensis TaxID=359359 RepID=UPI00036F1309|nr:nuclear transport factor 2 family protein [Smaragdicoccus niigatensis]
MTNTTLTSTDPKILAVQNLYDSYFRADLEGALADVSDDIDWAAEAASTSAPWYGRRLGKAGVAAFFQAIAENVSINQFDIETITSNDTDVIAVVKWSYTVHTTGRTTEMYMQHWWRFADGKMVFFRGSEDSEQTAAAFRH